MIRLFLLLLFSLCVRVCVCCVQRIRFSKKKEEEKEEEENQPFVGRPYLEVLRE